MSRIGNNPINVPEGVTVDIQAGTSSTKGFQFDIEDCTFTNRLTVDEAFKQTYDWKMNQNPTDLGTIIKFNNI